MKFAICILLSLCGHAVSQLDFGGLSPFSNDLSDFSGRQPQPPQRAPSSQFQPVPNNQPFTNNPFGNDLSDFNDRQPRPTQRAPLSRFQPNNQPFRNSQFFSRPTTASPVNQRQNQPIGANRQNQQNPQTFANAVPLNIQIIHKDDFNEEDEEDNIPTVFLEPPTQRQNKRRPASKRGRRPSSSRGKTPQVIVLRLVPSTNTNSQNPTQFTPGRLQPTFG